MPLPFPIRQSTGFVFPGLPSSTPLRRTHIPSTCNVTVHPRRTVLLFLAALPLSLSSPARADRTGKYSTKLTAKRRYLPRIAKGITELGALNLSSPNWQADVNAYVNDVAKDMRTAMELFATTYFSEGNRIGVVERELAECVNELFKALDRLKVAASKGDVEQAAEALGVAIKGANRYVQVAKLEDKIVQIGAP